MSAFAHADFGDRDDEAVLSLNTNGDFELSVPYVPAPTDGDYVYAVLVSSVMVTSEEQDCTKGVTMTREFYFVDEVCMLAFVDFILRAIRAGAEDWVPPGTRESSVEVNHMRLMDAVVRLHCASDDPNRPTLGATPFATTERS